MVRRALLLGLVAVAPALSDSSGNGPGVDLSVWTAWWEPNRARLVPACAVPLPARERAIVVEALLAAVADPDPLVRRSVLVAVAQLAGEDPQVQRLVIEGLADRDEIVAEGAALALGLTGRARHLDLLLDLALDGWTARGVVGRGPVPWRVRVFACFGLAVLAERDEAVRAPLAQGLAAAMRPDQVRGEVLGAMVLAYGCAPLPAVPPVSGRGGRAAQVAALLSLHAERDLPAPARAVLPLALVRLVRGSGADAQERVARLLLDELPAPTELQLASSAARRDDARVRGALLALGRMAEEGALSARLLAELHPRLAAQVDSGHPISRRYALLALAWTGTDEAETLLRHHMLRGKWGVRPWSALALGILGRARERAGGGLGRETLEALRAAAWDLRHPYDIGAYLLGLALVRELPEVLVLDKVDYFRASRARGWTVLAAGLGGSASAPGLRARMTAGSFEGESPVALAAEGLALLGDRSGVEDLWSCILGHPEVEARVRALSALGRIGDRSAVAPLVEVLRSSPEPWLRAAAASTLRRLASGGEALASCVSEGVDTLAFLEMGPGELGLPGLLDPALDPDHGCPRQPSGGCGVGR